MTIYGINVKVEKKTVDNVENYIGKEELIIEQSVSKGTELKEGDSIILYIPKVDSLYPDMVGEGWSQDEASDFCAKYNLSCTFTEKEDAKVPEGTVIAQSRKAGSNVVNGTTMRITIAKSPQQTNNNTNNNNNNNNNTTDNNTTEDKNTN